MSHYSLSQLDLIAKLIQADTSIVLTAKNWARLATELALSGNLVDMSRPPTPGTFKSLDIRKAHTLRVVNSGTDDEAKCDQVNWVFERNSHFVEARNRYAVRKGEKKEAMEWVDPESTHVLPEDLAKEWADKELHRRSRL